MVHPDIITPPYLHTHSRYFFRYCRTSEPKTGEVYEIEQRYRGYLAKALEVSTISNPYREGEAPPPLFTHLSPEAGVTLLLSTGVTAIAVQVWPQEEHLATSPDW